VNFKHLVVCFQCFFFLPVLVFPQLSAALGHHYHDVSLFLTKEIHSHLFPNNEEAVTASLNIPFVSSSPSSFDISHFIQTLPGLSSSSLDRKEDVSAGEAHDYLVCMKHENHLSSLQQLAAIRFTSFHQLYSSHQKNLFCMKLSLPSLADSTVQDNLLLLYHHHELEFSLFLPFPKLLKLDLTVHFLFHYLFDNINGFFPRKETEPTLSEESIQREETEEKEKVEREGFYDLSSPSSSLSPLAHQYHPFVSHYLSVKKIGVSLLFAKEQNSKISEKHEKRRLSLKKPLSMDEFHT
jgi:hypothetical protein